MATHSSILAWRIPGTEEPSGLPPMGSHRVGHNWSDLVAAAAYIIYIYSKRAEVDENETIWFFCSGDNKENSIVEDAVLLNVSLIKLLKTINIAKNGAKSKPDTFQISRFDKKNKDKILKL